MQMAISTNDLIVSVSGIRGIIGAGLSPAAALAFAQALGTYCQGGRVVLSRDSRPSGTMLRHAVVAGLASCGCDIHDLGIVPTPTGPGPAVGGGASRTRSAHPDHRQPQSRPLERPETLRRRRRRPVRRQG